VASSGDREGTPVAILEAAASGLPVIATRHAGIPEAVIHGETGLLVDELDIEAMAEHIAVLATDAGLAGALGRRARQHIRVNYSMAKSVQGLNTILRKASGLV
jgi:glycosyltransferase involved in cell wall biosynthesis